MTVKGRFSLDTNILFSGVEFINPFAADATARLAALLEP